VAWRVGAGVVQLARFVPRLDWIHGVPAMDRVVPNSAVDENSHAAPWKLHRMAGVDLSGSQRAPGFRQVYAPATVVSGADPDDSTENGHTWHPA
jgi:hypothetical protein